MLENLRRTKSNIIIDKHGKFGEEHCQEGLSYLIEVSAGLQRNLLCKENVKIVEKF